MTAPTISGTQHIANRLNAPESVHTPTPIDRIAGRLALVGAKVREDIHNRFSSSDEVQTEMSEAHNLWGNQIIRSAADFGSSDVPNIKQLYKASKLVHNVLEPAGLFEGASEQGIRLNEADVAKALKSVSPETWSLTEDDVSAAKELLAAKTPKNLSDDLRKDFDKFKGENSQLYVRTKMNDKKMFKLYQDDLAKRLALHNDLEAIRNGELIMHNGELYINALKSAERMKLGAPSTPKKSVREKLTDLDTERNRKIAAGIVIGTVAVGATIVLAHNEKVRNAIDGARAELKEYVDEHLPSEIKEKAQAAKQAVIEKSKPIVAKATEAIVTHAPTMVSDRLAPKLQANTAHQVAEPEVEDTKTAHMKRKVTAIALAATQTASGRLARAGLVKAAELGKGLNTPENRKKAGKATLVAGGVALTVTGIYRMSQNEKVQAVAKEAARKTAEATKQTTDNAKNHVRSLKDKAGEAKKKLRSHRTTKAETSVGESEANKVNLQAQLSNEEEN